MKMLLTRYIKEFKLEQIHSTAVLLSISKYLCLNVLVYFFRRSNNSKYFPSMMTKQLSQGTRARSLCPSYSLSLVCLVPRSVTLASSHNSDRRGCFWHRRSCSRHRLIQCLVIHRAKSFLTGSKLRCIIVHVWQQFRGKRVEHFCQSYVVSIGGGCHNGNSIKNRRTGDNRWPSRGEKVVTHCQLHEEIRHFCNLLLEQILVRQVCCEFLKQNACETLRCRWIHSPIQVPKRHIKRVWAKVDCEQTEFRKLFKYAGAFATYLTSKSTFPLLEYAPLQRVPCSTLPSIQPAKDEFR
jgi:hypothetical protein